MLETSSLRQLGLETHAKHGESRKLVLGGWHRWFNGCVTGDLTGVFGPGSSLGLVREELVQ